MRGAVWMGWPMSSGQVAGDGVSSVLDELIEVWFGVIERQAMHRGLVKQRQETSDARHWVGAARTVSEPPFLLFSEVWPSRL